MLDTSTLKALGSTILTFAIVLAIGAFTNAIGQDTASRATAPTASPYKTVESEAATAPHNRPDRTVSATVAAHNTP